MTITLDERPEIPLHPLDLTAEPPQDNNAQFCVGLIQSADPALASPNSGIGDMILGVPFLRNTYTVMAYSIPNADGSFNTSNNTVNDGGASQPVRPRLGLMSLTDPTVALEEFNTVRVLDMPLTNGTATHGSSTMPSSAGSKKLSVGIIVLIGLLGFFALCCFMFGIRWLVLRRKYRKAEASPVDGYGGDDKMDLSAFRQALRNAAREQEPSEEALRQMRPDSYKREKVMSSSTTSSGQTRIGDVVVDGLKKEPIQDHVHEFGYFSPVVGEHDEHAQDNRAAEEQMLIMGNTRVDNAGWRESLSGEGLDREVESSPERSYHQRTQTEQDAREQHTRQRSISTPLLGGGYTLGEFGEAGEADIGMIGIGTALRTSKIDASFRDSLISSGSSSPVISRGRSSRSPGPRRTSTGSISLAQEPPGHPIVL